MIQIMSQLVLNGEWLEIVYLDLEKEIILYFCPAKSNYMLSFSAYGPKTISEKT